MIYLDYNATAPLREPAFAAMAEVLRAPGNPSSVHRDGRQARRRAEELEVALLLLVQPRSYSLVRQQLNYG